MRHFLRASPLPSAVGGLPPGVTQAPATTLLVAPPGLSQTPPASSTTAAVRTVTVPVITPRTDVGHLATLVTDKAAAIGANVVHGLLGLDFLAVLQTY